MSDTRSDQASDNKVRRLSDAVRRVRIAESERVDAIVDLHEAEKARLSALAEALEAVFAEVPADDDFFLFNIAGGMQPRLWIDPTSHVVIGRDRRTYRFLKDTRLGRVVIRETPDLEAMADSVTDYIAEKTVERERVQEGELLLARLRTVVAGNQAPSVAATFVSGRPAADAAPAAVVAPATPADATPAPAPSVVPAGPRQRRIWPWVLLAFLIGMPAGALAALAYAWFNVAL